MALNRFFTTRPGTSIFDDNFFFGPSMMSPFSRDPFFNHAWTTPMPVLETGKRTLVGYEISESKESYKVSLDVPGVEASNMSVELEENGILRVSGGRKVTRDQETVEAKFDQRLALGHRVDAAKATADLSNGVLVVNVDKLPKEERKFLTVPITENGRQISKL